MRGGHVFKRRGDLRESEGWQSQREPGGNRKRNCRHGLMKSHGASCCRCFRGADSTCGLRRQLEQMPKEISKWPRRNGLSARKRPRPMSIDLGLVPLTPQKGHCARAASQAILKELLGKGLARRGVSGGVAAPANPHGLLPPRRALPETPRRCHHFGNLFRHLL